ncbi:MAG: adenine deaminase [Desulfobacteraceae bacterium]
MTVERLKNRILAARGGIPSDLVLTGGQVVNVFTGTLTKTDVALFDGVVVGLGTYTGPSLDVQGKIIAPGLIDGHIHLESTMLTPQEFARAVVPRGTTAVVADPHEIANVMGTRGLDYMLTANQGLPLDIFLMIPSCVPASHLETAGAGLGLKEMAAYCHDHRVLGLAEMMNFPGVINGVPDVLEKLDFFANGLVDGHAPLLSGPKLNAYRLAGPASDHECSSLPEAQEKLALGFHLMLREGSQAKNLQDLLPAVTPATMRRTMLVTDDCHPDDLLKTGHMDHLLRKATAGGLDAITAITMASLNTAEYFRLRQRGAIAPGYLADLIILDDLKEFKVNQVFKNGRRVAQHGQLLEGLLPPPAALPSSPLQVRDLALESFQLAAQDSRVKVIGLIPGQLLTTRKMLPTPVREGQVVADTSQDLLKLAVIERHRGTGNVGLGLVQGFGLQKGALASSVAHDSHNIIVVGANDADMLKAAAHLVALGGGLAVVADGQVKADLPLPVAGLMSPEPLEAVAARHGQVQAASRSLGGVLQDPFMALAFLALPVIPELKLTDLGLVDVNRFQIVSLFGED